MKTCSRWSIVGFLLLVAGLTACGLRYWYICTSFPDFPAYTDSKHFLHNPQADAQIITLLGAAAVIAVSSIISLIGIIRGPRTKCSFVIALFGPTLMILPFIWQYASRLWSWLATL